MRYYGPIPNIAHWAIALPPSPGLFNPFSLCLTVDPANGVGEEEDNYGAERNSCYDEPRLH